MTYFLICPLIIVLNRYFIIIFNSNNLKFILTNSVIILLIHLVIKYFIHSFTTVINTTPFIINIKLLIITIISFLK